MAMTPEDDMTVLPGYLGVRGDVDAGYPGVFGCAWANSGWATWRAEEGVMVTPAPVYYPQSAVRRAALKRSRKHIWDPSE